MADNQHPAAATTRGRRANQRYRRGVHNVELNANAKLALTQHFARKGRTHQSSASDPISLNISDYHSAPLGGRHITDAILPSAPDRASLTADPVYFYHPSTRQDLQSPLAL